MKRIAIVLACLAISSCKKTEDPNLDIHDRPTQTKSPTVANREDIIRQRDSMAVELVNPGDTITAYVFIRVDEQGIAHQPELKPMPEDPRIAKAAVDLVMRMHFNPATENGKPRSVLMKLPVRFARP